MNREMKIHVHLFRSCQLLLLVDFCEDEMLGLELQL